MIPLPGMRKTISSIGIAIYLVLMILYPHHMAGIAAEESASALIEAVNQLRISNGLEPYQMNSALMAAAQAHSNYQASIGEVTHTGEGGTTPRQRAIANGYGGGTTVFVSENIAGGTSLSVAEVVVWWQGDDLHLNTMLGANYRDVGAGVAHAGGVTYYTLDAGYVAGGVPAISGAATSVISGTLGANLAAPAWIMPVVVATPAVDGSIIHIVEEGQAPAMIADAYQVPLADLLSMNGLTISSIIRPGDRLIIRPPVPTAITTPEFTPSITHSMSLTPTRVVQTSTPEIRITMEVEKLEVENPATDQSGIDPILVFIAVLVLIGVGLVIFGSTVKRLN